MSVSVPEIAIVAFACILVALLGRSRSWLWGIPAQLAVVAVFSPADPISTISIGIPSAMIYSFALLRMEQRQLVPATVADRK